MTCPVNALTSNWQDDLNYSELVYSFLLQRENYAGVLHEIIIENGSPKYFNQMQKALLERLKQLVI